MIGILPFADSLVSLAWLPSLETKTVTRDPQGAQSSATPRARLILALACDDPRRPGAAWDLARVTRVELGRAPASGPADRVEDGVLHISLRDSRVSGTHARVVRAFGGWRLEDCGAKNGTFVNGKRIEVRPLLDGDVVEIGHHFFVFVAQVLALPDTPTRLPAPSADLFFPTRDPSLADSLSRVARAATSDAAVLITGETGTGKEVLARGIHARSERPGAWVPVNCGALTPTLVTSELFGVSRGAFSGADRDRVGLIRAADRGTLFLDELAELPPEGQAALLRALQEREVRPVGGTTSVASDFRLIAATNQDLDAATTSGAFRLDLLHRVRGISVHLPAVRARRCDLGMLIAAVFPAGPRAPRRLHYSAARALLRHDWLGNVRELRQVIEAAAASASGEEITLEDLPPSVAALATAETEPPGQEEQDERTRLEALLVRHRGNVAAVARALNTSRAQVHRLAERLRIEFATYR